MSKESNSSIRLSTNSLASPSLYLGGIANAGSLQESRVEQPKPAGALFYGFSRQCSRRFWARRSPPIWDRTRIQDPLSSYSAARPYRPGRYFILALNQVPDRERRGNFVPKFIMRLCSASKFGWTSLRDALTLLIFLTSNLRTLLRCLTHMQTRTHRCLLFAIRYFAPVFVHRVLKGEMGYKP